MSFTLKDIYSQLQLKKHKVENQKVSQIIIIISKTTQTYSFVVCKNTLTNIILLVPQNHAVRWALISLQEEKTKALTS